MRIIGDINDTSLAELVDSYSGKLTITSDGGDLYQGLAMYDFINSFDGETECEVLGMCASAATLPLMASNVRVGNENSRFLIHNPWTLAVGEASDFKALYEDMTKEEQTLVNIYEQKLNLTREEIITLMKENRVIDSNEALSINLITTIKTNSMKKEELEQIENNLFNRFKNIFKKESIKSMIVQTQDGQELDFGEDITAEEQIVEGVTATVDGSQAQGDYQMPDGRVFTFENGVLTVITEPETGQEEDRAEQDVEALQNEIAELKKELADISASNDKMLNVINNVNKEHTKLKALLSELKTSGKPDEINPPQVGEGQKARIGKKI